MSRKPSKPETRIEDYLDVMTGGNAALPQPILRIEFYYAFLAGMTVELPQPILDDEKLLAKICGMEVEAPTYIPGLFPRLYAYMAKKGGQDVQVPDPILRLERYWYDYSAGEAPSVQEYTGAVPVTFIADGTPLLDYLISGNTVQNGTPTPDNPIMPQGTGEKTGNLFDKAWFNNNTQLSLTTGLPIEYVGRIAIVNPIDVSNIDAVTLTYSLGTTVVENFVYSIFSGNTLIKRVAGKKSGDIIDVTNADTLYICLYIGNTNITVTDVQWIMLNTGSTALPYEPYGYKTPISSASTTTPVYLGEEQTTRRVKKLVLTGEETSWHASSGFMYNDTIQPDYLRSTAITLICSHYKAIGGVSGGGDVSNGQCALYRFSSVQRLYIRDNNYTTAEEFKAYLQQQYAAGAPVTVWYVLATPETAVVNESLMKIGDYADTLSMEQAGVQIPTANGSTTLGVETAVKPSEVYIKYRGEAVSTLSTLSAEVSSPEAITEEENPEETEEEENER